MNPHYEHDFDGGIYDPKGEERTDVYLKEIPASVINGVEEPMTFEFVIVNGSSTYSLVKVLPKDVIRLGKFLQEVAEEALSRARGE